MDIKFLVMDVDGTLTDGKVYVGSSGEAFKAFDIKDGCGIKDILPKYDIIPVVITARKSDALALRCGELGIKEYHQGCRNKLEKLKEILASSTANYTLTNCAYVGDDFLDLPCMEAIKAAGGMAVCPQNAVDCIKEKADFICNNIAGEGAVREFIEWYIGVYCGSKLDAIKDISSVAYDYARNFNPSLVDDGIYYLEEGVIANVMSYISKPVSFTYYETHRKFIDIQYIVYGKEMVGVCDIEKVKNHISLEYDEISDKTLYTYDGGKIRILNSGDVAIYKPDDVHRVAMVVDKPIRVRKIVFKIPV